MNKVLVLAFICLLIIASIGYCYLVKSQEGKEEKIEVYNPSTGEKWDSVSNYRNRKIGGSG